MTSSEEPKPAGPSVPSPEAAQPSAAPAASGPSTPAQSAPAAGTVPPAAAPKPAPPKPAAIKYPDPVFDHSHGRLLTSRYWPTEKWRSPFSSPDYRWAAAMLAGIVLGAVGLSAALGEISKWAPSAYGWIFHFVQSRHWPEQAVPAIWMLLKLLILLHVIVMAPIFLVWWERKISAHIQSRFGPMYVGGWHGWAQTIADGIKLFLKEDVTPEAADRWVHLLAPALVTAPAILSFAPISFGKELCAANLDVGILYVFAVAGISVIGIVMAGWASGNKYSLLGGLRSAAQLVSYELPRAFSIVPVLMFAGSLNLTVIGESQAGYWGGVIPRWYIFYPVIGQISFLIFLIASVAETNRTPFDIPEAESELVAGFHTEYSGMKFSLFFLAEYAYVLLASCLTASFFLGGGASPFPFLPAIPSWFWFLGKTLFVIFCFLWFRWTFPRLRVDRLMDLCWKFLLPWSFVNILFAGAYLLR